MKQTLILSAVSFGSKHISVTIISTKGMVLRCLIGRSDKGDVW